MKSSGTVLIFLVVLLGFSPIFAVENGKVSSRAGTTDPQTSRLNRGVTGLSADLSAMIDRLRDEIRSSDGRVRKVQLAGKGSVTGSGGSGVYCSLDQASAAIRPWLIQRPGASGKTLTLDFLDRYEIDRAKQAQWANRLGEYYINKYRVNSFDVKGKDIASEMISEITKLAPRFGQSLATALEVVVGAPWIPSRSLPLLRDYGYHEREIPSFCSPRQFIISYKIDYGIAAAEASQDLRDSKHLDSQNREFRYVFEYDEEMMIELNHESFEFERSHVGALMLMHEAVYLLSGTDSPEGSKGFRRYTLMLLDPGFLDKLAQLKIQEREKVLVEILRPSGDVVLESALRALAY